MPPKDIWTRLWKSPSLPMHRQTWYKFLFNAQPLGARIERFVPDDSQCPHCPLRRQTMHHFLFDCPLAQQVWQDFASYFELSSSPPLYNILFSWPASSSSMLGRAYGYRLQAGHAVALHTLWFVHCEARYREKSTTRIALSCIFRNRLRRHFTTLAASSRWKARLGDYTLSF